MRKVTKNPRLLGSWEDFKTIFLTWTSWRALGNLWTCKNYGNNSVYIDVYVYVCICIHMWGICVYMCIHIYVCTHFLRRLSKSSQVFQGVWDPEEEKNRFICITRAQQSLPRVREGLLWGSHIWGSTLSAAGDWLSCASVVAVKDKGVSGWNFVQTSL